MNVIFDCVFAFVIIISSVALNVCSLRLISVHLIWAFCSSGGFRRSQTLCPNKAAAVCQSWCPDPDYQPGFLRVSHQISWTLWSNWGLFLCVCWTWCIKFWRKSNLHHKLRKRKRTNSFLFFSDFFYRFSWISLHTNPTKHNELCLNQRNKDFRLQQTKLSSTFRPNQPPSFNFYLM